MDFENIIPLIIIAVAYLFKAFENAKKKEARKKPRPAAPQARRATPSASPGPKPRTETHRQPAVPSRPFSPSAPSPVPSARPLVPPSPPPAAERPGSRPVPAGWEVDYPPASGQEPALPHGARIQREVPEEILRQREQRERREVLQRKQAEAASRLAHEPVAGDLSGPEEDEPFDLRDAVIKSVILERREFLERRAF